MLIYNKYKNVAYLSLFNCTFADMRDRKEVKNLSYTVGNREQILTSRCECCVE